MTARMNKSRVGARLLAEHIHATTPRHVPPTHRHPATIAVFLLVLVVAWCNANAWS